MGEGGGLPGRRELGRVKKPLAGCYLEAAGPANHHQAAHPGPAQPLREAQGGAQQAVLGVLALTAAARAGRRHDRVLASGEPRHRARIAGIAGDDLHDQALDRRAASSGRHHGMTARKKFCGDCPADGTRSAEHDNLHDFTPSCPALTTPATVGASREGPPQS